AVVVRAGVLPHARPEPVRHPRLLRTARLDLEAQPGRAHAALESAGALLIGRLPATGRELRLAPAQALGWMDDAAVPDRAVLRPDQRRGHARRDRSLRSH